MNDELMIKFEHPCVKEQLGVDGAEVKSFLNFEDYSSPKLYSIPGVRKLFTIDQIRSCLPKDYQSLTDDELLNGSVHIDNKKYCLCDLEV